MAKLPYRKDVENKMKKIINDLKKIGVDIGQENPFEKEIPDSFKIYSYSDLVGEDNGKIQDDKN